MKKTFFLIVLAMAATFASAQVKVGDNPTILNSNAMLEVESSTKGLLLPRVALAATNTATPLSTHVPGMTVYNTATAGTAPYNVTPGYYYNDGAKWVRLMADTALNFWNLTGNALTTPGTNFLGTTDDKGLMFKVNNVQSGYISNPGDLIGTNPRNNTAFGYNALPKAQTTLSGSNTAVGVNALQNYTSGVTGKETFGANVALGSGAMMNVEKGGFNTAVGGGALGGTAGSTSWNNVAVGVSVMGSLTTGGINTGIGGSALGALTTGSGNVAAGLSALSGLTTGNANIGIGYQTGRNITTGSFNIVIGGNGVEVPYPAGNRQLNIANLITGTGLSTGTLAETNPTDQEKILKVGIAQASNVISEVFDVNGTARIRSLPTNGTANSIYTKPDGATSATKDQTFTATRTLVADANGVLGTINGLPSGNYWGLTGNAGTTSGTNFLGTTDDKDLMFKRNNTQAGLLNKDNTFFGLMAGNNNTSVNNTAMGVNALAANTTGSSNVAVGYEALALSVTGDQNVAVGHGALRSNISSGNTAVGFNSLVVLNGADAYNNTAVGSMTLSASTTGTDNTAIGYEAGRLTTTGRYNTALGSGAMRNNTTGAGNVAIGASALVSSTQATGNVAIGNLAMSSQIGSTANNNIAIGNAALSGTTGKNNIAIGNSVLNNGANAGSSNIVIGNYENAKNYYITGDNNIVLGAFQLKDLESSIANTLTIGGAIFGTGLTGNRTTPAGKIGILTTTPTEVFDVNGTTRLRELPTDNQPAAIYTKPDGTTSAAKDQTFLKDKMLVVDKNGVVGKTDIPPMGNWDFFGQQMTSISNYDGGMFKIPVNKELLDPKNEYDPTTYSFKPKMTGLYLFDFTINIHNAQGGGADLTSNLARIGIADVSNNQFVTYCDFVSSGTESRSITHSARVIVYLESTRTYFFGFYKGSDYGMILEPNSSIISSGFPFKPQTVDQSNTIFGLKFIQ